MDRIQGELGKIYPEVNMIKMPNMLMIGSTCKNAGKTALACKIIEKFKSQYDITVLKITILTDPINPTSSQYEITEETNPSCEKDTCRLLSKKPEKVLWLKTSYYSLREGFSKFMEILSQTSIIVCESTSLRNFVEPGIFVVMKNNENAIKPSAQNVLHLADEILTNNDEELSHFISRLRIQNNEWRITNDKI